MSEQQQNAVLQEALDQSHQFRQTAALRNGLPIVPPRNVIGDTTAELLKLAVDELRKKPTDTTQVEMVKPPPAVATPELPVEPSKLLPWLKRAAVLVGLSGAAGGAVAVDRWFNSHETVIEQPTSPDPTGDILKHLREQGYHLPPGGGK